MAALSVVFLGLQLYFCGAGIEFTDESYCLLFTSNPQDYRHTTTQFGYLYAPIFKLLGRNVWLARAANCLALAAASLIFFFTAVSGSSKLPARTSLLLASSASASTASFFTMWLPFPGYNSLNLLGLLFTATGMLLCLRTAAGLLGKSGEGAGDGWGSRLRPRPEPAGWILIGAGGWLCFMAKPPTAVALAFMVILWAGAVRGYRPGGLPVAAGLALVLCLLSAFIIDGSPAAFIARYGSALDDMKASGSGSEYGLLAAVKFESVFRSGRSMVIPAAAALFAGGAILASLSGMRSVFPLLTFLLLALAAFCVTLACDQRGLRHSLIQGWTPLPMFAGVLAFRAVSRTGRTKGEFRSLEHPGAVAATVLCLSGFPVIYGFGSNSPLPISSGSATAFLVGAFLVHTLCREGSDRFRTAVGGALICQVLALSGLAASWAVPFRQGGPLWDMPERAPLVEGDDSLRLPGVPARFLAQLHVRARLSGFKADTTVIDLTGVYPLAVYAISGRTYSSPFMVAGYSWSNGFARAIIKKTPCEAVAGAWLIWTSSPYFTPIDPQVLAEAGLDFPSGYASAFTIPGYWGDGRGEGERLHFLVPIDPQNNLINCLSKRISVGGQVNND
jgi:hypothetical protein